MPNTVRIQISGAEHSGKTSLAVVFSRFLENLGANVTLQRADPQLSVKLDADTETLSERIKGLDIIITEMQTSK